MVNGDVVANRWDIWARLRKAANNVMVVVLFPMVVALGLVAFATCLILQEEMQPRAHVR